MVDHFHSLLCSLRSAEYLISESMNVLGASQWIISQASQYPYQVSILIVPNQMGKLRPPKAKKCTQGHRPEEETLGLDCGIFWFPNICFYPKAMLPCLTYIFLVWVRNSVFLHNWIPCLILQHGDTHPHIWKIMYWGPQEPPHWRWQSKALL